MQRFGHVLQKAERSLRAPEPQRSRVLLELAQDLDDLFNELRTRGLSEKEALQKAELLLSPSAASMAALEFLHAPVYVRLAERFAPGSGHRAERLLFIGLTLLSLGLGGLTLAGVAAFESASGAMWILSVVLAWLVFYGSALVLQLPGGETGRGETARLATPAWLGAVALVTGLTGAAVEMWRLSIAAGSNGLGASQVFEYISRAADLMTFALSLLLASLLIWFSGYRRAAAAGAFRAHLQKQENAS